MVLCMSKMFHLRFIVKDTHNKNYMHIRKEAMMELDTYHKSVNIVLDTKYKAIIVLVATVFLLLLFTILVLVCINMSMLGYNATYVSLLDENACQDAVKNYDSYLNAYCDACNNATFTIPSIRNDSDGFGYFTITNCTAFWTGYSIHQHPNGYSHLLISPMDYGVIKYVGINRKAGAKPRCIHKYCIKLGYMLSDTCADYLIQAACPDTIQRVT
jgi:hypothetical protein